MNTRKVEIHVYIKALYFGLALENWKQVMRTRSSKIESPSAYLGDRFGPLRDGVLCQFTGKDETDGGLNLSR